jgi:hypothetical protein
MSFRRSLAPSVVVLFAALGCYSPNITPGGFVCGAADACPDNFQCAADHRCYRGKVDAAIDMACMSATSLSPVPGCSSGAIGGACNPACQTECSCGWCAVVGGASECLTGSAGTADVGEVCDPMNSKSCKAGLYCQPECGDKTGRCYRYCPSVTDTTFCGSGSSCNVTLRKFGGGVPTAGFLLCSLVSGCTVVPQYGCQTGFGCYPSGTTATECDCAGTGAIGDTCGVNLPTCAPGNLCIGPAGGTATCHQQCNMANGNADCTAGGTCSDSGTLYGYCM